LLQQMHVHLSNCYSRCMSTSAIATADACPPQQLLQQMHVHLSNCYSRCMSTSAIATADACLPQQLLQQMHVHLRNCYSMHQMHVHLSNCYSNLNTQYHQYKPMVSYHHRVLLLQLLFPARLSLKCRNLNLNLEKVTHGSFLYDCL
jgi:hypothetical protein